MSDFPMWPDEFAKKYKESGCWQGQTFGEMLRERAAWYGDNIAIVSGNTRWSYKELDTRADKLAAGFIKLGIKKQDRVVVQMPNIAEFFEVCFALFRIGALPVFALPMHRKSEISYFCEFTEAVALIVKDSFLDVHYVELAREMKSHVPSLKHVIVVGEAEEFIPIYNLYEQVPVSLPQIRSSDVAFLQLSGGSTGLPKLIPRTHDDYIYSLRRSVEICALDHTSVYLTVLPVTHNFPMSSPGVLGTLFAAGTVVLAPMPSPDIAFPLIEQERVTITSLVPPLALVWLEALSSRTEDLSSLRVLQVGGSKFSPEAARRLGTKLECKLQQVFGMAEGLVNYTRLDDDEETIYTTQGRPMSQYDEIRIVDDDDQDVAPGTVGNLLTRGPYTIRGYYKAAEYNAKAFTKDGFYRTGDLVKMTPKGNIVVEGRAKDQINRGGDKIAAEEVENHLIAHPSVYDAAIVSMPDDYLGERACAFIITRGSKPTASELKTFLIERGLAYYKIPDRLEFVDSFPYTGVGKISKKDLREYIAQKLKSLK